MPWLIKDNPDPSKNLFFVHVPRCGGTSLMYHFGIPQKALKGRSCWGTFGMRLFFWRYKVLEGANFPFFTGGNFVSLILFLVSIYLRTFASPPWYPLARFLTMFCVAIFLGLTFIFTAPIIGRWTYVRRLYLIFIHYILFRWMESIEWCTGTNKTGYIMHLTTHKLLKYGYLTPEQLDTVCSMAIVRNPYSRMVSMWMFNRYGRCESFHHFVKDWHKHTTKHYKERGEMEEWYTPCHAIPQFEFTHNEGKQLVQSIVKQEELKFLKTKEEAVHAPDSSVKNLPDPVRQALLDMPHFNARPLKKKWWDYYDQETLNLTYELYKEDFLIFDYSPIVPNRPDLHSPLQTDTEVEEEMMDRMQRDVIQNLSLTELDFRHSLMKSASFDGQDGTSLRRSSTPSHSSRYRSSIRNSLLSSNRSPVLSDRSSMRSSVYGAVVGMSERSVESV